ncbi:MAG: ATP-dependent Clp protease proteolytic subunit, partial [uncultured Craurococcus sp.]
WPTGTARRTRGWTTTPRCRSRPGPSRASPATTRLCPRRSTNSRTGCSATARSWCSAPSPTRSRATSRGGCWRWRAPPTSRSTALPSCRGCGRARSG